MMAGLNKVAILMADEDMSALGKIALEPLGYEVQPFNYSTDAAAQLTQYRPNVLIMALGPHHSESWQVLDSLVGNAVTASCPVVAIVFSEEDAKKVTGYANVAHLIFAPYDFHRLIGAVKASLRQGPSDRTEPETFAS